MVFFITICRLLSWLAWYEHRQQFHSSSLSTSADLSAVSRESLDSGRQWMVDSGACATVALWCVCAGQHGQSQCSCAVQRATCLGVKDEPRPVIVVHLSTTATCQCHAWDADQATALTGHFAIAMESDVSMDSLSDDKPAQEDRSVLSAHIKTMEAPLATLPTTPQFAKHRVPWRRKFYWQKHASCSSNLWGPGSTRTDKHPSAPRNVNRKHRKLCGWPL